MVDAVSVEKDSATVEQSYWACPAAHISPLQDHLFVVAESGRAVQRVPLCGGSKCEDGKKPAKRGDVKQFSRASRLRLLWLTAQVANDHLTKSLFLTLTYPRSDPTASNAKRHLDTFSKRLLRKFPSAAMVWKLEYTKANTPHYHCLLLGVPFWDRKEVAACWADVVHSDNPHHRTVGTRIEKPNNPRHAISYLTKYMAKTGPLPESHHGRVWGKVGSIMTYFSPKLVFTLTRDQVLVARRALDALRKSFSRRRRWKREHRDHQSQRWFLSGSTVCRYLKWLGSELVDPTHPPPESGHLHCFTPA